MNPLQQWKVQMAVDTGEAPYFELYNNRYDPLGIPENYLNVNPLIDKIQPSTQVQKSCSVMQFRDSNNDWPIPRGCGANCKCGGKCGKNSACNVSVARSINSCGC